MEQSSLYDFLDDSDAGTPGTVRKYRSLGKTQEWILRTLSKRGPMTAGELVFSKPADISRTGVTGRLAEMNNRAPFMVKSVAIPGAKHLLYRITEYGEKVLRGVPVEEGNRTPT